MPKLLISAALWMLVLTAKAQQPALQWVKTFKANNQYNYGAYNNGRTIKTDAQGNVYTAGFFEYGVDFDPGAGVYSISGGTAASFNIGIYISKLDANGNFVWAIQLPVLVEFSQIEMKLDKSGNIYLVSDTRCAADMDPGPAVQMMGLTGFRDAFVIKIDSNGNLLWVKQFGGPGDTGPQANALEIDNNGNVLICGVFNHTVDFDPGPGTYNLTSTAHFQSYIVKLNSNGDFIWARQFGNSPTVYSGSTIMDVECDAQNQIVLIGYFSGTCDFDPGAAVNNITSSAGSLQDGFICKLDNDCNLIWVKPLGQTGGYNSYLSPTGIDIDEMNNIVTTGYFLGNFDFDPGPDVHNVSCNPTDCFILKLDTQGNYLWSKTIGGKDNADGGNDVVTDDANNVYITGSFGATTDFDPGAGSFIINSSTYTSAVIKLNADGIFSYAAVFQVINDGYGLFRRMTIDAERNIYITGGVAGTIDFDPGPTVYPIASTSNEDPFVLKLGSCKNSTMFTLDINTCKNYTLNNQIYDSSGTYKQVIPNAAGCDSTITLHLTINKKRTLRTITICEGEHFYAGGADKRSAGIYYDTLQTVLGCDSVIVTTLVVNPRPLIDLGPDKSLCRNSQLTLSAGTQTSYLWQDSSTSANYTVNKAGIYWVRVSNSYHCSATDSFTLVSILEPPSNFLKKTDSVCSYEGLSISSLNSYIDYKWSTGTTGRNIQVQHPGTYVLSVTDANGCTATDSIAVSAKYCLQGIYIPTAFTPNGDGTNDFIYPILGGIVKFYEFSVFNRWGQLVFTSKELHKGWDGTFNGIPQDPGMFTLKCTYQFEGEKKQTARVFAVLIR